MPTRPRRSVHFLLLGVLVLALGVGSAGLAAAQDATPAEDTVAEGAAVFPPDAEVAGAALGEWGARWWQRMASFPVEVHPFLDERGERCGAAQAGPVFFLQAPPQLLSGDAITCVVPENTPIFVPVIGATCSTVEPPPFFGRDEAELRACVEAAIDAVNTISVSVDGREVPNPEQYRATSPLVPLVFAEENIFEVPAGVALAVTAGYQLILEPLPVGEHEIQVYAEIAGEVHTDLTFRVVVVEPTVIEPAATPGAATPVATPEA